MRFLVLLLCICTPGAASAAEFLSGTIAGWPSIKIAGQILPGDAATFRQMSAGSRGMIVQLASPGGNLLEGLSIGQAIHDNNFSTLVANDELCASACGIIWLSGVHRYAGPRSNIGFHAAYDGQTGEAVSSANAVVGAYYSKIGLSYDAIAWMTSAQPNSVSYLNAEIAQKYSIDFLPAASGDTIIYTDAPSAIPTYGGRSVRIDEPAIQPPVQQRMAPAPPPIVLSSEEEDTGKRLAHAFARRYSVAGLKGLNESVEACYASALKKQLVLSAEYCVGLDTLTAVKALAEANSSGQMVADFNSVSRLSARFGLIAQELNTNGADLQERGMAIAKRAQSEIAQNSLSADASPAIRYGRAASPCQAAERPGGNIFVDLCRLFNP